MEVGCEGELPTFPKFIEDLRKCATLRNAVIHAEWDNLDESGYTYVKMNFDKNGMQQNYWQFTPKSLQEIDEFILKTCIKFETYEDEKHALLSR